MGSDVEDGIGGIYTFDFLKRFIILSITLGCVAEPDRFVIDFAAKAIDHLSRKDLKSRNFISILNIKNLT